MRVTVLGAGAWGTALALALHEGAHNVAVWGHDPNALAAISLSRRNERYLPGVAIAPALAFEPDFNRAIEGAEVIVLATPSKTAREIARKLAAFTGAVVTVSKGIEYDSGLTMTQVLAQEIPGAKFAALSGPTFAPEVARKMPSAAVVASADPATALLVQQLFHRPYFRIYTNRDVIGVELGGALKNVIAIAAGVCDGLGFGDNSKGALVTRAIAEEQRLGIACGAKAETFSGLSGLGDLMVTCFSRQSRNRAFGERLGKGESIDAILPTLASVVEGYPTARSAMQLARKTGVEAPIITQVHAALYEGKSPKSALLDLVSRESTSED